MCTFRSRLLSAISTLGLCAGLLLGQEGLALIGLAVLVWIALQWVGFRYRIADLRMAWPEWTRSVKGVSAASVTATIDEDCSVELSGRVSARIAKLRLRIEDVLPASYQVVQGTASLVIDPSPGQRWLMRYQLRPQAIGRFALPGVRVELGDALGFFRLQTFVPLRQQLTVLPFLIRPQTTVSVLKQNNVQMFSGIHSHRRPGFSTELLGIRQYEAGDPPRNIAWKASARMGRLMSCEYESEVPTRATIVAEMSPWLYRGRPGPALADRVISAAASMARLLLADRDPVACLCVNDSRQRRLPHAHGERQLTRLLQVMLSFAEDAADLERLDLRELTQLAWEDCRARFPELFEPPLWPGVRGFHPRRRLWRQRELLSAVWADLYPGGNSGWLTCLADDRVFRDICLRYFRDHPLAGPPQAASFREDPLARRRCLAACCRGLLEAASRANDNELFVIIGSLPMTPDDLERLVETLRVVRGAHHRVMLIDIGTEPSGQFTDPAAERLLKETRGRASLMQFHSTKDALVPLGVKMSRVDDPRLIEKVAAEVELLKSGRLRTPVAGRAFP